jgi:hypothetical protein
MIAARRHNVTDDLISDLIRAEDDGDRLNHPARPRRPGGVTAAKTTNAHADAGVEAFALPGHRF